MIDSGRHARVLEAAAALRTLGELVTPDLRINGKGAAMMIGVSQKTLRNWRSIGEGPRWWTAGVVWYRLDDVVAWLEAKERSSGFDAAA